MEPYRASSELFLVRLRALVRKCSSIYDAESLVGPRRVVFQSFES